MRPSSLTVYFQDIENLAGVGPRNKAALIRLFGRRDTARMVDLLFHMPSHVIDRRSRPRVQDAIAGQIATLEVTVIRHIPPNNRRSPYKVVCQDDSGFLTLTFFNPRKDWLKSQLPDGELRLISGKIDRFNNETQITHPDYMVAPDKADEIPAIDTVYPLTHGIGIKVLRRAIKDGFNQVQPLSEWLDQSLQKKYEWPAFHQCLNHIHFPKKLSDATVSSLYRTRLAYDELLATQLALTLVREKARQLKGRALVPVNECYQRILNHLPFDLTGDQKTAIEEIKTDMQHPTAMLRLVQGDVGSGKTIVALMAMALAVDAGTQAALLAPTEILARQHLETIQALTRETDLKVELLLGRHKGKTRSDILARLKQGDIDIIIGTHAIIQDKVQFADLGLAVIDEQHRFGVQQRMALASKTVAGADLLVMTATPIPRTLMLTAYGDMDVSKIMEKPPGRKPIDTKIIALDRLGELVQGLGRALESGQQIYWVCPLVAESENLDLAAAEDRYVGLKKIFGDRVGLVHGKMKAADKDAVMDRFQNGDSRLLVATTVIEVGVNVPSATIMVIEHAERFGLAQLHQLRGRVGRSHHQSTCLLLRANHIGSVAQSRLKVMRDTEDGFIIAEEDLRLRGAGEMLGTRQSGLPDYHFVDLEQHKHLIEIARDDARLITAQDPDLQSNRGQALRELLYLFEKDEGVRLLKGG